MSRDRSKIYRSGMSQGAPDALQVADRFHLVQNLTETLEMVLSGYSSELKAVEQQVRLPATTGEAAIVRAKPTATAKAQARFQAAHERRVEQQQQVNRLNGQQWSQAAIAQAVGVSVRTSTTVLEAAQLASNIPSTQIVR